MNNSYPPTGDWTNQRSADLQFSTFPGFSRRIVWIRFSYLIILTVIQFLVGFFAKIDPQMLPESFQQMVTSITEILLFVLSFSIMFYSWRVVREMPIDEKPFWTYGGMIIVFVLYVFALGFALAGPYEHRQNFLLLSALLGFVAYYLMFPYWNSKYRAFVERWEMYGAPDPKPKTHATSFLFNSISYPLLFHAVLKILNPDGSIKDNIDPDVAMLLVVGVLLMLVGGIAMLICFYHQTKVLQYFSQDAFSIDSRQ